MNGRRQMIQFVVVMVLVGMTAGYAARGAGWLTPEPSASPDEDVRGATPFTQQPQAAGHVVEVGGPYPPDLRRPPTGDRDQSKLWYQGTSWWGVLADAEGDAWTIHRLDWPQRAWVDTGVVVDDRIEARSDVLWGGAQLYAVSAGTAADETQSVILSRFTFDATRGTHDLDDGFPISLTDRGVQGLHITMDAAGGLWLSFIADGALVVRHSGDRGTTWSEPFGMPAAERAVVAHTAVAHGDGLAMLWSSQAEGTIHLATHRSDDPPEAWAEPTVVLDGAFLTDDHITARSLEGGPSGPTLFAMVKTSADLQPESDRDDPQMLLLEKRADEPWRHYVVGRVRDRHTRPLLVVQEDARMLHLFVVAPFGAGSVHYKTTPADEIALLPGRGAPFMDLPEQDELTNPTSTKQNVTAASGIVVLASDLETERYVMGALTLR